MAEENKWRFLEMRKSHPCPDAVRKMTEDWLERYKVPYNSLLMRKAGDHRPDEIIKLKMLQDFLLERGFPPPEFIVDDRQRVVDMWRKNGYNVLQCNAWEEEAK